MGNFVKVASEGEIGCGCGKQIEVAGKTIALWNVDGTYYAIDDSCTHVGAPLSGGELDGTKVICPWHGGVFDVTTGAVEEGPPSEDVACYAVRVVGSDIEVEL